MEDYLGQRSSERGCTQIETSCDMDGRQCGAGMCLPMLGGFNCICPPQITGDTCEKGNIMCWIHLLLVLFFHTLRVHIEGFPVWINMPLAPARE